MKKIASTIALVLCTLIVATAQNSKKESPQNMDDFSKQMEQMSRMMQEQMKKMFAQDNSDSTQNFNFSFKNLPFGSLDSTMTQSFGLMFDGKNWQSLSPNGDSSTNESMRGLNIEEMFKGFGDVFKNGFPMSPNKDNMPRVQPLDKKRKGEPKTKNQKYETEEL